MSDEERRANAAAAAGSAGPRNGDLGASTDEDLSPPRNADGGLHPTVDQPEQAATSVAQLLLYFTQQNQRMENLMTMMQHDRPEVKAERLANVRLDERNFRNVPKYSNLRND